MSSNKLIQLPNFSLPNDSRVTFLDSTASMESAITALWHCRGLFQPTFQHALRSDTCLLPETVAEILGTWLIYPLAVMAEGRNGFYNKQGEGHPACSCCRSRSPETNPHPNRTETDQRGHGGYTGGYHGTPCFSGLFPHDDGLSDNRLGHSAPTDGYHYPARRDHSAQRPLQRALV